MNATPPKVFSKRAQQKTGDEFYDTIKSNTYNRRGILNEDIAQLVTLQAIDLEIDKIDSAVKSEQNRLDDRISALAREVAVEIPGSDADER